MEDVQGGALPITGGTTFELTFTPFQIQTVKVAFQIPPLVKKA